MSFTDDDLKRLKRRIKTLPLANPPTYQVTLNLEDAEALLARLEAAEASLQSFRDDREHRFTPEQVDKLQAWRKSAQGEA